MTWPLKPAVGTYKAMRAALDTVEPVTEDLGEIEASENVP